MQKKSLLLTLAIFYQSLLWGQGAQTTPSGTLIANQNATAAMPNSAILELRSNNKGMLPPRMTTEQIGAIASPAVGLMVYDIDMKCLKAYNGTEWNCANANIVALTPLSSSFAFSASTDNYAYSEAIAADNFSNNITVGSFRGAITFGKTSNSMTLTSMGEYDGFIVKHDKDGNLLWATQISGSNEQNILDIAIDNSGNIAVAGLLKAATNFYSTDGGESSYTNSSSYSKIFVAKYNASGVLMWYKVHSSAGNYDCWGKGVNFDIDGNVVATGMYRGIVAFDANNLTSISNTEDIFVVKYGSNDGAVVWVRTAGGNSNTDYGKEIVCDASNNIYTLGYYTGISSFGEAPASVNFTSRGNTDIFIIKYLANGTFAWAKTAGSVGEDWAGGITYSSAANAIYTCGSFTNTFTFGSGLGTNPLSNVGPTNHYNGFLSKYDLNGNIQWSAKQGSTDYEYNHNKDVDVDSEGNPYICGEMRYNSRFYNANNTTTYFYMRGVQYAEPFIAKYNSSGVLQWSIGAFDGYDEFTWAISVKNNTVFVAGSFKETLNFGYQQLHSTNGSYYGDLFIWRYQE